MTVVNDANKEKKRFLYTIWMENHARAPKSRDELLKFAKHNDPTFTCNVVILSKVQKELKEFFAKDNAAKAQVKALSTLNADPIMRQTYQMLQDLQAQFRQEANNNLKLALKGHYIKEQVLEKLLTKALSLLDAHGIAYDAAEFDKERAIDEALSRTFGKASPISNDNNSD